MYVKYALHKTPLRISVHGPYEFHVIPAHVQWSTYGLDTNLLHTELRNITSTFIHTYCRISMHALYATVLNQTACAYHVTHTNSSVAQIYLLCTTVIDL